MERKSLKNLKKITKTHHYPAILPILKHSIMNLIEFCQKAVDLMDAPKVQPLPVSSHHHRPVVARQRTR